MTRHSPRDTPAQAPPEDEALENACATLVALVRLRAKGPRLAQPCRPAPTRPVLPEPANGGPCLLRWNVVQTSGTPAAPARRLQRRPVPEEGAARQTTGSPLCPVSRERPSATLSA